MAAEGDTVDIQSNGLYINGVRFSKPLLLTDSQHRKLQPAFWGKRVLRKGEVFLASDYVVNSFDSRYFGIINIQDILSRITPFLVD